MSDQLQQKTAQKIFDGYVAVAGQAFALAAENELLKEQVQNLTEELLKAQKGDEVDVIGG